MKTLVTQKIGTGKIFQVLILRYTTFFWPLLFSVIFFSGPQFETLVLFVHTYGIMFLTLLWTIFWHNLGMIGLGLLATDLWVMVTIWDKVVEVVEHVCRFHLISFECQKGWIDLQNSHHISNFYFFSSHWICHMAGLIWNSSRGHFSG